MPWLGPALVALSQCVLALTAWALYQRRRAVFASCDRPLFAPDWVAFTFPTVSTANAAVYFARVELGSGSGSASGAGEAALLGSGSRTGWRVWAAALAAAASTLTLAVACHHIIHHLPWGMRAPKAKESPRARARPRRGTTESLLGHVVRSGA